MLSPFGTIFSAAQRSHIKYFPDIAAYGVYYDLQNDIADIVVETFATRVQQRLVEFLRINYGDACANRAETFWTGKRSRMCLEHSRYSVCNHNMGVEKTWKLIKAICSPSVLLSTFLGHLVHFIRTAFGEEHHQLLRDAGFPNSFIRKPVVIKVMWDGMQERHRRFQAQEGCRLRC